MFLNRQKRYFSLLTTILGKSREPHNWSKAISSAEFLVHPSGSGSVINPRLILGADFDLLTKNIRSLLGSNHPVLNTISSYYFNSKGKHIRPLIVLLMSHATIPCRGSNLVHLDESAINQPSNSNHDNPINDPTLILPSQKRLAEITEMIHTASLLHDDVIDVSSTRRSTATANAEFGNKMAILAGDFLLARASIALARLRNVQVVELLATVISNLVEGEFMQLRNNSKNSDSSIKKFDYYLEKTYLKTASLIAESCKACVVLGACDSRISQIAYDYGRNLGLAFQVFITNLVD